MIRRLLLFLGIFSAIVLIAAGGFAYWMLAGDGVRVALERHGGGQHRGAVVDHDPVAGWVIPCGLPWPGRDSFHSPDSTSNESKSVIPSV